MKPVRLVFAFAFAAAGGVLLDISSPEVSLWPAAILGATLIITALINQAPVYSLLLGAVAGAAFWLPHISWLTLYLGLVPWLALSVVMIAWFSVFGYVVGLVTRAISVVQWLSVWPQLLIQALAISSIWVAREHLQSTMPYGGFAWGRLAHSFSNSPLIDAVSWIGFSGLSGFVAFNAALLSFTIRTFASQWRLATLVAGISICLMVFASFVPSAPVKQIGSTTVAAIQGNSQSGIFDDRENGDVFRDHVVETRNMLSELERSGEKVDIIVWPENSAEFQITQQPLRLMTLQQLSARAQAPIVVGTILENADGSFTNSSLVIDEEGITGERYDKRRPVPFAEYMPNRPFYRALAPHLVDLVQLDYSAGVRSSVLDIETSQRIVRAGIAICFDIIFDDQAVVMNNDGAQIVFAQTNNADFGTTDQSAQQLAIARLRAVEMGRVVVNISTVGTSAIISNTGQLLSSLTPHTSDHMVTNVPLFQGSTPALRFGAVIAATQLLIAAVCVVFSLWVLRRSRKNLGGTALS